MTGFAKNTTPSLESPHILPSTTLQAWLEVPLPVLVSEMPSCHTSELSMLSSKLYDASTTPRLSTLRETSTQFEIWPLSVRSCESRISSLLKRHLRTWRSRLEEVVKVLRWRSWRRKRRALRRSWPYYKVVGMSEKERGLLKRYVWNSMSVSSNPFHDDKGP